MQRFVHDHLERTHVVDLAHRIFVGHLGRLYKILAAQRDPIDAADSGGLVHQAFDVVNGFWSTCATVRASTGGVGHDTGEVVVDGLDVVNAALYPWANEHLNGQTGHGGVSAYVGQGLNA